jgi:hypothetical protein
LPRSYKAKKKAVSNSIPSFRPFALTNNNFKWLHPEAWEDEELKFFLEKRSNLPGQILLPPRYSNSRSRNRAAFGGRWVLETAEKEKNLLAWVELHCFYKSFTSFFAFFSSLEGGASWSKDHSNALSQIISAFFISGDCDRVEIASDAPGIAQIKELNWGQAREVLQLEADSMFRSLDTPPLKPCTVVSIESSAWWLLDNAKKDLADLSYLVRRAKLEKVQRAKAAEPRPLKRFGILSSLFGRR